MVIKLGINGFGRIGRVIFRASFKKADLEIVAINDPAIDLEYICYLIKFDSTHGKFGGTITHTKDEIYVDGTRIRVFHEKQPSSVPWQTAGVQYVIEASGMFTSLEKASGHLASDTVRRVLVTAPSVDVPMIILGVNHDKLNAGQKVISCGSSTLYCLAPIVKVLEDCFGVAEGFITSIHAMTPSLKPLDGLCLRGKHWRDHRSIHQNIIPAATGACKALGRIVPRVKDKLSGLAFRVPIVNVSVLDLTVRLNSNTTLQDIIKNVAKASTSDMRNIIKISKEEAVSSDFIGESHSCILDADSSLQLKPNFFKLVCWYENEYSYACRVLDSIFFTESQILSSLPPKINLKTETPKRDRVQQTDNCRKEVLCSTSQDTGLKSKLQSRLLALKKPITAHNSGPVQTLNNKDIKRRNDIFKIYQDDKEDAKRQNRTSFFHSCVEFTPQNREEIECIKAHERLENLKKEFSKMVSITECLLKKSFISNAQVNLEDKDSSKKDISKSINILPDINVEEIKRSCDTFTEIYDNNQKSSPLFDMSGDYRSSFGSRQTNTSSSNINEHTSIEHTTPLHITSPRKVNYEIQNKLIIFAKVPKDKSTSNSITRSLPIRQNLTDNIISKVPPEQNIIKIHNDKKDLEDKKNDMTGNKDLVSNIKQVQCCVLQNIKTNKNCGEITKTRLNQSKFTDTFHEKNPFKWKNIGTSHGGCLSLFKKKSAAESSMDKDINNKITINHDIQNKTKSAKLTDNINIENKDEKLQKDPPSTPVEKITTESMPIADMAILKQEIQDIPSDTNNMDDAALSKISLDEVKTISSPERIMTESDETSKCGVSPEASITISNIEVRKHKQDIYDKLDSMSGTDSNNSFHINERKSQVINISDLTNSLEDLARLDKICKIIEISDELSTKLFSALDNTEGTDLKNKKWSFKDLCERIKLDDFCEKVFGKSST